MTGRGSGTGPSAAEIREACHAGFRALDLGEDPDHDFARGFGEYLAALGYQVEREVPCTCADSGLRGHSVQCRWLGAHGL